MGRICKNIGVVKIYDYEVLVSRLTVIMQHKLVLYMYYAPVFQFQAGLTFSVFRLGVLGPQERKSKRSNGKSVDRADFRHDSLLKTVIEGKINRTKPRGRHRKMLLDHLKDKRKLPLAVLL